MDLRTAIHASGSNGRLSPRSLLIGWMSPARDRIRVSLPRKEVTGTTDSDLSMYVCALRRVMAPDASTHDFGLLLHLTDKPSHLVKEVPPRPTAQPSV